MRNQTTLKDEYFNWIVNFILGGEGHKYYGLCAALHDKPFRWFVHNDENRLEDGLAFRRQFVDMKQLDESHLEVQYFLKRECSMLEFLVALTIRINDYMYEPYNDRTAAWFFEMLGNLGLKNFTGRTLSRMKEVELDDILESLLDRTYDYNGTGSLFPVKRRPKKDMAKTEIWYQFMEYLDQGNGTK